LKREPEPHLGAHRDSLSAVSVINLRVGGLNFVIYNIFFSRKTIYILMYTFKFYFSTAASYKFLLTESVKYSEMLLVWQNFHQETYVPIQQFVSYIFHLI
jgi:hypothetical protein